MNNLPEKTFAFEITSFEDAWRLSEIIAGSSLAPKGYAGKPGDCFVAMQFGSELGLSPLQSLQNIATINGRPSIWGDAALALVRGSGLLSDFKEYFENESEPMPDEMTAWCVSIRTNGEEVRTSFSVADAKRAGLWGKQGPWTQYPKRMLKLRARGFNLRDNFTDILKGIHVAEESMDAPPVRVERKIEIQEDPKNDQATDTTPDPAPPKPKKPIIERISDMLDAFGELGISDGMVMEFAGVQNPADITESHLKELRKKYSEAKKAHEQKNEGPNTCPKCGLESDLPMAQLEAAGWKDGLCPDCL